MTTPLAVAPGTYVTPATLTCGVWLGCYPPSFPVRLSPRRLLSEPTIARLELPRSEIKLLLYEPEPRWLYPVLGRVHHLSHLGANWDSYGGQPPTYEAVYTALAVMARILRDDSVPPAIVPTSEGGIQLEWHRAGDELEIRVAPKGEISVFRLNEAAGQADEVNDVSLSNLSPLVTVVGQL